MRFNFYIITTITFILCAIATQSVSSYNGVSWNQEKKRWQAEFYFKGTKFTSKYFFEHELDAVTRIHQFCEIMEIPQQNPKISEIPNQQLSLENKISKYNGVCWHKKSEKWYVQLLVKGEKQSYGGMFNEELDAAKRVNQLCEKFGIPEKNHGIGTILTQKYQEKKMTSLYYGVCWHKQIERWLAQLKLKGGKCAYLGSFKDELDAAKRVNQICKERGIPLKNPEIGTIPNPQRKHENTSQYYGVCWDKRLKKWKAQLQIKNVGKKFGGCFKDEQDAAKRVNQLCEEFRMTAKNPAISGVPNQFLEAECKTLLNYDDAMQAEFENLIQILDENNDPMASTLMKETLLAVMNYEETTPQSSTMMTTMTEKINLRTKNGGESALSICAKHGFSNIVQFLISKGAKKEHFTNEHQTPLSLAVRQNHLKIVQILFEEWISPNSHQQPYLHLSPIFNVKSREITQILIDNDAVTNEIYNNKNQSPLTVACQNGYLDVVECLLDDRLDINHLDIENKSPLFYALANKHNDVAHLLLSRGAQQNTVPTNTK